MSTVNWTDEQRAAIHHGDGALLVSAAAGSGKTAVLVQRAVWMMTREENPVSAGSFLILTFTNAAAEELRGRIAQELETCIAAQPHSARLRRQKLELGRAFIGTIDAYCLQLVRENFAALDLPPDVAPGDAALLEELAGEALGEVMEEQLALPDFSDFAVLYGRARSDAPAEQAILSVYRYMRTLPNPRARMEGLAADYEDARPLAATAWGAELLACARGAAAAALRLALRCESDAAVCGITEYAQTLRDDALELERLCAVTESGRWDEAAALAGGFSFGRLPPARGADGAGKARVQQTRRAAKAIVDDIREQLLACTEAEHAQDAALARGHVRALVRAVLLFDEKFGAAKRGQGVLDFADFELLALELLRGADGGRTALAEAVCGRWAAVMVDEYQDTNELQDALYACLARADGGNLFYVGDVKQSIYRFRNAEPNIFLAKKRGWAQAGAGGSVITLAHNFRSAAAVIDGVNFLFGQVMSEAVGEVAYEGGELLRAGREDGDGGGASFELHMMEGGVSGEADYVAKRISDMLKSGEPVYTKDGARACRAEDFCVLTRVKKSIPAFMAALRARGVAAVADLADSLLQAPEVLPLLSALRVIDNPGDDIHLAATLLGPLFRFSPAEVTALRAAAPRGRLWAALSAAVDGKSRRFAEEIALYRRLAANCDTGRLCGEVLARTGYLCAVGAMEDGAARRDNLLRFTAWAAEVGKSGRFGLAGFLRIAAGGTGREAPAPKSIPGHVSILTIHKSKGLEFPFCFVADTARRFNIRSLAERVQVHAELGVGLCLRAGDALYPTAAALAVRSRAAREGQSEELRALYVAATRARQRAVFTFAPKNLTSAIQKWASALAPCRPPDPWLLLRAACPGEFLIAAALCHADGGALWELCGLTPPAPRAAAGRWHMEIHPAAPAGEERCGEEPGGAPQPPRPDADLLARVAAGFAKIAPRAALSAVPAKRSVSQMAGGEQSALLSRPAFMYEQGLTAAERGTARHAFMQYADFGRAARDAAGEIARLLREGYISAPVAAAVDAEDVRGFFASPLYGRVARAARVLREYDFITAVPSAAVQPGLPPDFAGETVLVQGIADLVLVNGGDAEIVDYKTDRGVSAAQLAARYAGQLALYRGAVEKRLGVRVARCTIWSFALGCEVDCGAYSQST